MELPFPGMDPYLELPALWPDVHARLISAMCDAIQEQLGPNYIALITPYIALENIEIAPARQVFVPDVGIVRDDAADAGAVTTAITPAPLTIPAQITVPTRYARIEIRSVLQQTLITAIELLSPANKRAGADGADAYEKKRQELFASSVHLLDIDLLRAGIRPRLARRRMNQPDTHRAHTGGSREWCWWQETDRHHSKRSDRPVAYFESGDGGDVHLPSYEERRCSGYGCQRRSAPASGMPWQRAVMLFCGWFPCGAAQCAKPV